MTPWLLIPVKSFAIGKSRLRTVLTDDTRRALNEYFLRRMLATAGEFPGLARTAVIVECESALRIAAECGVHTVRQTAGCGLNRAAREGVDDLQRRGVQSVLLIACDVPTIRASDLHELAALGRDGRTIVICPEKHRTGTNAILLPASAPLQFQFGEESMHRHCSEVRRAGFEPFLHDHPRIAFDIDTPQDLAFWLGATAEPAPPGIAEGPREPVWPAWCVCADPVSSPPATGTAGAGASPSPW